MTPLEVVTVSHDHNKQIMGTLSRNLRLEALSNRDIAASHLAFSKLGEAIVHSRAKEHKARLADSEAKVDSKT